MIEPLPAEKAAGMRNRHEEKGKKREKERFRGARKKRDPSSSEGEDVKERSNSGDIGEVTKKRKASPVTTAASRKKPRLSDEGSSSIQISEPLER